MKQALHRLSEFCLRNEIVVLGYHGVTEIDLPFQPWTQLPVKQFEQQMESIAQSRFNVLPLSRLVRAVQEGAPVPQRSIAITFDDGFRNNVRNAVPILERFNFPATFFLVAGLVGHAELIWSDRIAACLMSTAVQEVRVRQLGTLLLATSRQRALAYRRIVEHLKTMAVDDKNDTVELLLAQLSSHMSTEASSDIHSAFELMTWEDARQLASGDLFEVGGHSCKHEILTRMPASELVQDVGSCKNTIEGQVGQPVTAFAYPNGGPDDFDDECVHALTSAGWRYAVTSIDGRVHSSTDMFRIPRLLIGATTSPGSLAYALSGADTIRRHATLTGAPRLARALFSGTLG